MTAAAFQIIDPSGQFAIQCATASGGNATIQKPDANNPLQLWQITSDSTIFNKQTGFVLTASGGLVQCMAPATPDPRLDQQWIVEWWTSGVWGFYNLASGEIISLPSNPAVNDPVEVYGPGDSQSWSIVYAPDSTYIATYLDLSSPYVLDVLDSEAGINSVGIPVSWWTEAPPEVLTIYLTVQGATPQNLKVGFDVTFPDGTVIGAAAGDPPPEEKVNSIRKATAAHDLRGSAQTSPPYITVVTGQIGLLSITIDNPQVGYHVVNVYTDPSEDADWALVGMTLPGEGDTGTIATAYNAMAAAEQAFLSHVFLGTSRQAGSSPVPGSCVVCYIQWSTLAALAALISAPAFAALTVGSKIIEAASTIFGLNDVEVLQFFQKVLSAADPTEWPALFCKHFHMCD